MLLTSEEYLLFRGCAQVSSRLCTEGGVCYSQPPMVLVYKNG